MVRPKPYFTPNGRRNYVPTEEEIEQACLGFQREWTDAELALRLGSPASQCGASATKVFTQPRTGWSVVGCGAHIKTTRYRSTG